MLNINRVQKIGTINISIKHMLCLCPEIIKSHYIANETKGVDLCLNFYNPFLILKEAIIVYRCEYASLFSYLFDKQKLKIWIFFRLLHN